LHLSLLPFIAVRKSTVFSSQFSIIIGGIINATFLSQNSIRDLKSNEVMRNITKPFHGKIVGFFFNDVKVLDLATEGTFFAFKWALNPNFLNLTINREKFWL